MKKGFNSSLIITLVVLILLMSVILVSRTSNITGNSVINTLKGFFKVSYECNDHIDNDADGYCDYSWKNSYCKDGSIVGDSGCSGKSDNSESTTFPSCTPSQEICDGKDNDCDNIIDDNLVQQCGSNIGECIYGTQTCTNGVWGSCTGSINPSQEICDGKDNNCNGQIDEVNCSIYHFEYPADKKNGYYPVPKPYCPVDKCTSCIYPIGRLCGQLYNHSSNIYKINEGYTENFTYSSEYPIYGAWEIKNFVDFKNKCFVGDCNEANRRHVLCIDENNNLKDDSFQCNKWVTTTPGASTNYCVNGSYYNVGYDTQPRPGFDWSGNCSKIQTINFYYVYNNFSGLPGYEPFEGYSADWKIRWELNLKNLSDYLQQFGMQLNANYYEYKLSNNSAIPAAIFDMVLPSTPVYSKTGDIHVTILAGKKDVSNYGYQCTGNTKYNPCEAATGGSYMRIPDKYDALANQGFKTLMHEFGHSVGCPHTGFPGSLASHLYSLDRMSYGEDSGEYLYECRIIMWLLGQQ